MVHMFACDMGDESRPLMVGQSLGERGQLQGGGSIVNLYTYMKCTKQNGHIPFTVCSKQAFSPSTGVQLLKPVDLYISTRKIYQPINP